MHASDFARTCHHAGWCHGKNLRMIWLDEPTRVAYGMLMKRQIMIGLALAVLAAWPALSWADFVATVATVHEGDRLTIYHDGKRETIYLKGIDCPDLKQPFGKQARRVTAVYVETRKVVIRGLKRDRQGRLTADVLLEDGRNVAHELIKEGLAWARVQSRDDDQGLNDMEELASASHQGLWADPNPVPPWKWKVPKNAGRKFSN